MQAVESVLGKGWFDATAEFDRALSRMNKAGQMAAELSDAIKQVSKGKRNGKSTDEEDDG
jgi:hypothetical protein